MMQWISMLNPAPGYKQLKGMVSNVGENHGERQLALALLSSFDLYSRVSY